MSNTSFFVQAQKMIVNCAAIDFNLSEILKNGGSLHTQFPVHAALPHALLGVVFFFILSRPLGRNRLPFMPAVRCPGTGRRTDHASQKPLFLPCLALSEAS